jgi:MYXO-CTERM domain-containing protein
MRLPLSLALVALVSLDGGRSRAATSTASVPSVFGGNGHNASFDGRLYLIRTGPGWQAFVLRPEALTLRPDGLPDATAGLWSSPLQVVAGEPNGENALAICEPDPARAPYACDASGNPGGPFACYDVWVLDSDAVRTVAQGGQSFRRRRLLLRVAEPGTPSARPVAFTWGPIEPVTMAGGGALHGIEPTVTRDGRLMVWNGSLDNGDQDSVMMYATAPTACAATGWSAPRSLSHMVADPAVNSRYRLAARPLRAADGTPFADGAAVPGAYPWLLPDGDGVMFSAALMPCRGVDDPFGCGPRRNGTSVLGYPTNWGVAHIDGGVNPSTTDEVRLFFSSPGPSTLAQLPVSAGHDVWPFFGSNTSNYVEISFDDGLDGQYAGLWHLNESITAAGDIDRGRSPDVSGYYNTAVVHGAVTFPAANNGVLGKAAVLGGGWLEAAPAASLNPVGGITLQATVRPAADPDCDGDNNYRFLLYKGAAYSLILEETGGIRARVGVEGGATYDLYSGAELATDGTTWTAVSAEYDGASGVMQIRFDDVIVAEQTFAPAPLAGSDEALRIGGVGPRPACPAGASGGNFDGTLDEVSVSRIARHLGTPEPPPPDASTGPGPDAAPGGDAGNGGGADGEAGGCGCRAPDGGHGGGLIVLAALVAGGHRRRRGAEARR